MRVEPSVAPALGRRVQRSMRLVQNNARELLRVLRRHYPDMMALVHSVLATRVRACVRVCRVASPALPAHSPAARARR